MGEFSMNLEQTKQQLEVMKSKLEALNASAVPEDPKAMRLRLDQIAQAKNQIFYLEQKVIQLQGGVRPWPKKKLKRLSRFVAYKRLTTHLSATVKRRLKGWLISTMENPRVTLTLSWR